jgi:hypothetical protein
VRGVSRFAELFTQGPVTALWSAALTGWLLVLAGLWRGLPGRARGACVLAHVLTLGAIVLRSMFFGYGLLDTVIAATAGWWALAVVTGGRPERLLDAEQGRLVRLGVWCALAAAAAVVIHDSLL